MFLLFVIKRYETVIARKAFVSRLKMIPISFHR
jgi:hypothetical protein